MSQIYNIYCDESCHLQNDKQPVMLIGCTWCPIEEVTSFWIEYQNFRDKLEKKYKQRFNNT